MAVPERARLVRIELEGELSAAEGCLLVRGDERPFALAGDWAGGGAIVGSEPLRGGRRRTRTRSSCSIGSRWSEGAEAAAGGAVGGGWFGFLGYNLGARLERVPPPPPRHVPLPDFALAFYDHVLRLDRRRPLVVRGALDGRARRGAASPTRAAARAARRGSARAAGVGRHLPARAAGRRGPHDRDRRMPRAHRRRRDLPGEPLPAARGRVEGRPARPVRPHRGHARAAPRRASSPARGAPSAASPRSCSCAAAAARW